MVDDDDEFSHDPNKNDQQSKKEAANGQQVEEKYALGKEKVT